VLDVGSASVGRSVGRREAAHSIYQCANPACASLSKLAKAGEVVKADRGYALPSKHERSEVRMAFEVGKRVVAESESTSRRPRAGVVEEVLRGDPSPRYRIRWDDGHESIYTPASGALRAEPRPKRQRQSTPRKR
jgi:hypothetical protein